MVRLWFPPRHTTITVRPFATMATTLITLTLVRLTAITALATLWAAHLSAWARGTTGVGADADGVADTMADMDTLADAVLMAAEDTQGVEPTVAGRRMAAELAATQVAELGVTQVADHVDLAAAQPAASMVAVVLAEVSTVVAAATAVVVVTGNLSARAI